MRASRSRTPLLFHTGITSAEVIIGFILGSLLGAFFGYVLGMSPTAEVALSPYILALQIAPKVAFAPLFILWMGFTIYPKILVAVLIVFFPVMVNVLTAIRTVDPDMINLARAFKASRVQIFWKIEFPASLPPGVSILHAGTARNAAGQVVTRTMLLENVWDYHFDPQTNVIDVHITRLRRKIERPGTPPLIETVRGIGYVFRGD